MADDASISSESLRFTGLFEAEVLTELLLWRWDHPLKSDREFREQLVEWAAEALRKAVGGERLFAEVPAEETNFITAVYYAEWATVSAGEEDPGGRRQQWLDRLRDYLPSCFCAQQDLPP